MKSLLCEICGNPISTIRARYHAVTCSAECSRKQNIVKNRERNVEKRHELVAEHKTPRTYRVEDRKLGKDYFISKQDFTDHHADYLPMSGVTVYDEENFIVMFRGNGGLK